MTAAPASYEAFADAAISATLPGSPGLSAWVATGPVSAAVMMGLGMVWPPSGWCRRVAAERPGARGGLTAAAGAGPR